MAARAGCVELLEAILRDTNVRNGHVPRQELFGRPPGDWKKQLSMLSDRVVDLILEASIRGRSKCAAELTLKAGANPNLLMWMLGGSFNEHFSALSYSIREEQANLVKCLLDAEADPAGLEFEGRNKPLFEAMNRQYWETADLLLDRGAKFEGGNLPPDGRGFLGCFRDELAWIVESIGSLITLCPPETKPWFYQGNGQGGQYRGFMDGILWHDNLNALKKYEAKGLSTKLAAAELITALTAGSDDCVNYLLQKAGAPPSVYSRIRERYPAFGIEGGSIHPQSKDHDYPSETRVSQVNR
ncbi:MAG: ankyrin repeat domain-containing protein [Verrucomicrobia bacterium]|nr:ankyrin repeat domain-containing protein [Verrucomicrobiota bacterium]